jgi:hypothetical protein
VNRTVIQAVSDKNKISRALVKTSHTAGTKSYARWAEDLVSNLFSHTDETKLCRLHLRDTPFGS